VWNACAPDFSLFHLLYSCCIGFLIGGAITKARSKTDQNDYRQLLIQTGLTAAHLYQPSAPCQLLMDMTVLRKMLPHVHKSIEDQYLSVQDGAKILAEECIAVHK